MSIDKQTRPVVSASSVAVALLGLWLIIAPWILGAPGPRVATSGIICGGLILVCSAIRFSYRRTSAMSWINALLGAWTIGAASVFGENSGTVQTWNYTIVGIVIAGLETLSLSSSAMRPHKTSGGRMSARNSTHTKGQASDTGWSDDVHGHPNRARAPDTDSPLIPIPVSDTRMLISSASQRPVRRM